jgi:hypothetical protein
MLLHKCPLGIIPLITRAYAPPALAQSFGGARGVGRLQLLTVVIFDA